MSKFHINLTNFSPRLLSQFYLQQGMPMRPAAMGAGQQGMMGVVTVQPTASNSTPYMIQPQNSSLPMEHQNGNSKNVQLDPFGAF